MSTSARVEAFENEFENQTCSGDYGVGLFGNRRVVCGVREPTFAGRGAAVLRNERAGRGADPVCAAAGAGGWPRGSEDQSKRSGAVAHAGSDGGARQLSTGSGGGIGDPLLADGV